MKVINGELFIGLKELKQNYKVPRISLYKGVQRNKENKTEAWRFVSLPGGKDNVLICVSSIPDRTREKYNLPALPEMVEQLSETSTKRIDAIYQALKEAIENYVPFMPEYSAFAYKKAQQYAQTHSVFNTITYLTRRFNPEKYKLSEVFEVYQNMQFPMFNTKDYTAFCKKIKQCQTKGIRETVIHKNVNSKNAVKTTDFHLWITEAFASMPYQYSYSTIAELVNQHCRDQGLKEISHSWVKYYLAKPEVRNAIAIYRYGENAYNQRVRPYVPRQTALYAGDVWMMDGTPLQFFCKMEDGRLVRLNLFVVIDVHSRKIVGFDISESEDRFNVINALKMAFSIQGHLPYEIVHDNFSANKTDEIKDLKISLERMGVLFRATSVGNAQDKAYVERWIGTFQTVFNRHLDEYIGEGIRSKRTNARPSPEFIEQVRKEKGFMSRSMLMTRIAELILKYNNTGTEKNPKPIEKYQASDKPHVVEIRPEQLSLLFWNKRVIKVHRSMIKLTVNKQEYMYRVFDNDLKLQLNGEQIAVRYDEKDLSQIHLFDAKTDQFICESRQYVQPFVASANQTEADVHEIIKQESHNNSLKKHIADRAKHMNNKAMKVVNEPFIELANPATAEKGYMNDSESIATLRFFQQNTGVNAIDAEPYKAIQINNDYIPIPEKPNYNKVYTQKATLETL